MKKFLCIFALVCVALGLAFAADPVPVVNGIPGSTVTIHATNINGTVSLATVAVTATNALNATTSAALTGYTLKTNTIIYLDATTNLATNTVYYSGK